ncbi:MAG: deoxyribodipyrimidine photo-lyase [Bryobacterales bacterium]|nr:deoxyribodipyrimidine photo-lyase [Bryobacterales bacterium]
MDPRITPLNDKPRCPNARYVLYWMQMNRRVRNNHALEYAIAEANALGLPVLVYEAVTYTYPYASDRFTTFLLEGVPDTSQRLRDRRIGYLFYLRRNTTDPNDTLYRLAADAALIVSDDYPSFVAASHNMTVPTKSEISYVVVDSSCIVPMRLIETKQYGAYTIRPKIHKLLNQYLKPVEPTPVKHPWKGPVPLAELHTTVTPESVARLVASCDIDHSVKPSLTYRGGASEAERHLQHFLARNLPRYAADRNEPTAHATSNLSPWLHFGHISSLEVALAAKMQAEDAGGTAAEFLEELIVRRELAFNHARFAQPDPTKLGTVPNWARETLKKHAKDTRPAVYTREQFERAETYDQLWNATQKELLLRGKIHGYYRMYWGKKIIEWSATHEDALETMIYLHDRYALDGRDPNTYTNILWCFGLHDRPWQERPIFGMVRYMSLDGMKRKTGVDAYLREISHLELTGTDPFRLQ